MKKINFYDAKLDNFIVHTIGSKFQEEGVSFQLPIKLENEDKKELMLNHFISAFKLDNNITYSFFNEIDIYLNEANVICKNIFDNKDFTNSTENLARHLYSESNHPKIKAGDLQIIKLSNCMVGDELVDAIGIFKSENKDSFLNTKDSKLKINTGILLKKIELGAIIFNTNKEKGYTIILSEKTPTNTQYFIDNFLKIIQTNNDFTQTTDLITHTHSFINNNTDFDPLDKSKMQAVFMQSFKEMGDGEFSEQELFENLQNKLPELADTDLQEAWNGYMEANEIDININFSEEAASLIPKKYDKSVLKFDKNFHLYIHGGHDQIERGYSNEKKKNFIKIFFNEEK